MIQTYNILLGSKMLKLNNPRDEDWLEFVDLRQSQITNICKQRSIPSFRRSLERFAKGKYSSCSCTPLIICTLYQLTREFHDEEYPFGDFSIFENKQEWIACLKRYINATEIEEYALKGEILPKRFYHLLYQYYMITEDTHWISDEAKINVQKIHDLEMPSSYFYELRELINSL